ncbi:NHL repeat-containing protein [Aquimarina sp. MAR_2010_214]|uniref:cadherin domain-containing protein n=1 Tax=Aquimarina sp. MAR_2010_214 TaxID=1250026 RepID=UPI000C70221A|nr:cadherin domain-containing protein [Aquimarina sp. MAR_2010_214]PKV50333.1 NHL repeat-containing protein [Aquimarina sp. MAR_2010_214]
MKTIKLLLLFVAILALSCSKDDDATTPLVNKAPEITAQSFNVSESAADADVFGTVKATDADKDALSYSITANSDDLFEITKTGALSLVAGKTLDFETKTTHEITVEVTDGKAKAAAKITIAVVDVDENMPPVIADQSFAVSENPALNAVLATVIATDPNNDNLTYTIANPAGAVAEFEMAGNEIKLKSGFFDYETLTSHTATVTVDDGTLTASAQITITVTDVNEAPTFPDRNYTFSQPEDIDDTVIIATVTATDPENAALTYFLQVNPGSFFEINSSGEISLATGKFLDYETDTTHTVKVKATAGNASATQDIIINVTDVIDVSVTSIGTGFANLYDDPTGVAVDGSGNVYVADFSNHVIRKITPSGVISTYAGSGTPGFADGNATTARFNFPFGVAVDAAGNVYVADRNNHRIRKITPAKVVTTVAGGIQGYLDATGTGARFNHPQGVTVDGSGNIYVADNQNHRIRKITPAGAVSTFAGSQEGFADATGTGARFDNPSGITVDTNGNLYVADNQNHRIRKITPAAVVTTLAGRALAGFVDGPGTSARFLNPTGVAVDASGNVYVADRLNQRIRKVTSAGVVSTIAGSISGFADGIGTVAKFRHPSGVAVDASGNVYVADERNNRIRKIIIQ